MVVFVHFYDILNYVPIAFDISYELTSLYSKSEQESIHTSRTPLKRRSSSNKTSFKELGMAK